MKRVIITLVFCIIFSSSAYAKKPEIMTSQSGTLSQELFPNVCKYTCTENFSVVLHAHGHMNLRLYAMSESKDELLYNIPFYGATDMSFDLCSRPFNINRGESWAIVWALQSTKGKERIIDATEETLGTCPSK